MNHGKRPYERSHLAGPHTNLIALHWLLLGSDPPGRSRISRRRKGKECVGSFPLAVGLFQSCRYAARPRHHSSNTRYQQKPKARRKSIANIRAGLKNQELELLAKLVCGMHSIVCHRGVDILDTHDILRIRSGISVY